MGNKKKDKKKKEQKDKSSRKQGTGASFKSTSGDDNGLQERASTTCGVFVKDDDRLNNCENDEVGVDHLAVGKDDGNDRDAKDPRGEDMDGNHGNDGGGANSSGCGDSSDRNGKKNSNTPALKNTGSDDNDRKERPENDEKNEKKKPHKLSLTKTNDFNETLRKRGVLYISRIPPKMNPTKVRTLLSEYGVVTRVYLVEEDPTVRKRRRKLGGNGTKRYVEGWVEFQDKKIAKHVGMALNNTPITNNKRSVHYGDLWNVKYLNKFKWSYLTEKVAYERRIREQKLRLEMMQARRENAAYTNLVETGRKLDKIEERRRKRKEKEEAQGQKKKKIEKNGQNEKDNDKNDGSNLLRQRKFRQTKPVEEMSQEAAKRAVLGSLV